MGLKKILKRAKEQMSPLRWKMNYVIVPIWLAAAILPLAVVIPLTSIDNEKYLPVFIAWIIWFAVLAIALLASIPFVTRKEAQLERERYGYLFEEPKPLGAEELTVDDEGILYTLGKDGVHVKFPIEVDQVFEEDSENAFYIPWERAEFALATQSYLRRVHIALAVIPFDDNAIPCFIPMNEEVFSFVKAHGFEEELGAEWLYLYYNPKDAFKQLLIKGRIRKMRNKKTGKPFVDEQGNFIEEKE